MPLSFRGLTVIVALCGLLVVPDSVFRSLAVGAIVVVVVAICAATTLLPAALRLLGDRVDTIRIGSPGPEGLRNAEGIYDGHLVHPMSPLGFRT